MSDEKPTGLFARIEVAKKNLLTTYKDRLSLVGLVIICIFILVVTFWPKTLKLEQIPDSEEKAALTTTLKQNIDYIASLKTQVPVNKPHSGYKGGNPYYPPTLRGKEEALSKETLARMNAPSTFYTAQGSNTSSPNAALTKTFSGNDANSQFLNTQEAITAVSAKSLPHPAFTVPAGEMIPAILETGINSELAGMVGAITARDSYALQGNRTLIPKGATLVGQFNAAVAQGQSRVFVVWNRVQLPSGVIITLNSPSSDTLGRAGLAADSIDRHFFERFGTGALLSVLGAYSATAGVNGADDYNSRAQYRAGLSQSFQQTANQALMRDMQIAPTLQINQGASINIFVAHDLDFYNVRGKLL